MQVILKEDVANLGYKDDVVTVKSGYGRNYLIPQGKAVIASLTIGAKTSSTGTIFGSVNNIQIAEALEKLGHIVDRKQIVIKDTVKEVGNYKAIVKLHKEVSVEIPFEVVAE